MNSSVDDQVRASSIPRVLVLLASYNGQRWIGEQITSITRQLQVSVSIVIRDDCSSDSTVDIIGKIFTGSPHLGVLHGDKPSGSAGENFRSMFRQVEPNSDVEFVALSDQDDIWNSDKLAAASNALWNSGASAYSAAVEAFWPDGRTAILSQSPNVTSIDFLFDGAGQGCTFVMTADFFRRVQDFCTRNKLMLRDFQYHDWLIYILCRTWNEQWIFDQIPRMRYRQHGGNEIGARGGLSALRRRLKLVKSGWYRRQVLIATQIYMLAGGADPLVLRTISVLKSGGFSRRFLLCWSLLIRGRRRTSDRVMLAIFALCGWV